MIDRLRPLGLLVALLAFGCRSSSPAPTPAATAKPAPASPTACNNACIEQDSDCHQKCMEDDSPPPDEGDSCASKCSKALEACVGRCK